MIHGYDVSNWQPAQFPLSDTINKKPIDFVIIKVTQGTGYENPKWVQQRDWARSNGLSVGYYHFGETGRVVAQADYFLSRLGPLQPGEHLWFDWETNPDDSTAPTNGEKDEWISYVRLKARGHRVGLYCNTHFWKNVDRTSFFGDALWIATGGIPAGEPPIEAEWLIHQHSTANSIDHDVARFGSRAEMKAWAGDSGGGSVELLEAIRSVEAKLDGLAMGVGANAVEVKAELAALKADNAALKKLVAAQGKTLAADLAKRLEQ